VINSRISSGISISDATMIIVFGCVFNNRAKLRSFRDIVMSRANLLKSFKIKRAGLSTVNFSINSRACNGLRLPMSFLWGLFKNPSIKSQV
jgi:hypothetical protein